jgi:hypothetical protein
VVYDCIAVQPLDDVVADSEEFIESDVDMDDDDDDDDLEERMEELQVV